MRSFTDLDNVWPAGLLRRLMAMVYDALVLLAVWMLVGFIAVALNGGEANESPLFHNILFVVTFVFFAYFWMRAGMTLGMQAWRLRVQSLEGRPITLQQSLIRFVVAIISFAAFGLGYWWIFFDREQRSWSDIASRSRVVVLPNAVRRKRKSA
ncbi:RDD family protein [Modicisalibacter luteus]|uniref:RDD family protein n=1 Tax=Modicisalibacter luteus TaxID=453962 RepID=A0ABV7LYM8_9GAMM|nr:RDD family protein [Halomonas lutea]GHB10771.1 RDD family protein [Halomonas lutea]